MSCGSAGIRAAPASDPDASVRVGYLGTLFSQRPASRVTFSSLSPFNASRTFSVSFQLRESSESQNMTHSTGRLDGVGKLEGISRKF